MERQSPQFHFSPEDQLAEVKAALDYFKGLKEDQLTPGLVALRQSWQQEMDTLEATSQQPAQDPTNP